MNKWVAKSIELANRPGYLDKLSSVYPVVLSSDRPLPTEMQERLRELFERKDRINLLRELINLDKFPIKDPYVAFFRNVPSAIDNNPTTVERITNTIFSMGFENMLEGIEEPKEFNRKIGMLFKRYLPNLGYPMLPKEKFKIYKRTAILEGSDADLKEFAKRNLGYKIEKGLDVLAKIGGKFIVGEAKFLTDFGGHQNAQFEDAMRLIKYGSSRMVKIAILDGVVWIKNGSKMFKTISNLNDNQIVLSALLLKDFLDSLH